MNKHRRDVARSIRNTLINALETAHNLMDEEQEAIDNMPENLQDSQRGQAMQDAVDALDNAIGFIEEAGDYLKEIIGEE